MIVMVTIFALLTHGRQHTHGKRVLWEDMIGKFENIGFVHHTKIN